ncbi:MAG: type II secretion system protein [Acidobacteria bacterium]|nr:MAG: type II secretion system protein [Acidobacteriota bacterium]REJ99109.1 MAG: type II secretion system protein [Acidobacteriota bacterium]REK16170.1 MAG: type II secretion system protein [Acidobacteriota bacterium]REK43851.1 MAG: type II secretion system protein [Acidobacteriota bacterium]
MNRITKRQEGFSIVELLIVTVLFLIVMAAVFGILQMAVTMRDSLDNSSEIMNAARVSINSAGRDAVNAGLGYSRVGGVVPDDLASTLIGIPMDPNSDRDVFTAIMAGNDVNSSVLSLPGEKNDVVAFMYRDLAFNSGAPMIINSVNYSPSIIDLRGAPGSCVDCRPFDLFLVESGNGNHALAMATAIVDTNSTIRVETGDPLSLNRPTDSSPSQRSILTPCGGGITSNCLTYSPQGTAKRVFLVSYGVNSQGVLVRTLYGNNAGAPASEQIRELPLSNGVQSFQVRYLLQDGTYTDDPSNANVDQGFMNEIVQLEMTITVKPKDGLSNLTRNQVVTLSSTFSTRNIKYDIE